jgi:hypothetical protein
MRAGSLPLPLSVRGSKHPGLYCSDRFASWLSSLWRHAEQCIHYHSGSEQFAYEMLECRHRTRPMCVAQSREIVDEYLGRPVWCGAKLGQLLHAEHFVALHHWGRRSQMPEELASPPVVDLAYFRGEAQPGLDPGVGHPICLCARHKHLSTGGQGCERTPRSCSLPCGSPRRMTTHSPGRTLHHVSSSHL